ncbi:MAG TPA: molybdenum cofactor biosynthesis protein MoaE [Caulobacterales bacterium]|nr:molybdenum cofactor biosynthesis protein MoaE [Caulobacterales bacterium]
MRVVVATETFSPEAVLGRFAAATDGACGAIASFVGYCRARSGERRVERIELQHYPGFTETEIERLALGVAEKHGVSDIVVVHRVGAIPAGEAIVLVAAASAHRAAAFAAVQELMDYLKTDAPFWKREVGPAGARWIEPTEEDRARRAEHGP